MKKINTILIIAILVIISGTSSLVAQDTNKIQPRYQGVIIEKLYTNEYTYLKIDEKTPGHDPKTLKSFWIVVSKTPAKIGDYVRFKKELVTKMYRSKQLNKNFDELIFASALEYRVSE